MDVNFQRELLNNLVAEMPDNLIPELVQKLFQPEKFLEEETDELPEEENETDELQLAQMDWGMSFLLLPEDVETVGKELDAFEAYIVDHYVARVEELVS